MWRLLSILLIAVFSFSTFAQESEVHTVAFDEFSFSFESAFAQNVNIEQYTGDAPENGPGFSDAPHTAFILHNGTLPEGGLDIQASIRVYRTADLAPYPFLAKQADALQSLLVERPDLSLFEIVGESGGMADVLPYLPVLPHGQTLNARVEYFEADVVQGIRYITYSNAAPEPFLSGQFSYTFQGVSSDGQYYVTVNMPLETGLFPAEPEPIDPETFMQQWPEYLTESIAALDAAAPDDFTPTLNTMETLVQSFTFAQ